MTNENEQSLAPLSATRYVESVPQVCDWLQNDKDWTGWRGTEPFWCMSWCRPQSKQGIKTKICGFVLVKPYTVYSKFFFNGVNILMECVNTIMLLLWSKNVSTVCDEIVSKHQEHIVSIPKNAWKICIRFSVKVHFSIIVRRAEQQVNVCITSAYQSDLSSSSDACADVKYTLTSVQTTTHIYHEYAFAYQTIIWTLEPCVVGGGERGWKQLISHSPTDGVNFHAASPECRTES
jgi:hypothetical protein